MKLGTFVFKSGKKQSSHSNDLNQIGSDGSIGLWSGY
jgi:hypothetical protein